MKFTASAFLLALFSISVIAEYDCLETLPETTQRIKLDKSLPATWWRIGELDLLKGGLAKDIAKTYPDFLVGNDSGGYVCLGSSHSYLMISQHGFGNSLRVSAKPPKCNKECSNNIIPDDEFPLMAIGLKIGQNKEVVSKLLGIKIIDDVTSIEFQNIEDGKDFEIWHIESLKLTFNENKLVDVNLDDYREGN